jgi:type II secretory pathway predicted ATPase ExeA
MYDQYFGFQESPFSVTPDPNFFYENPVYQEAYASLRYGIAAKKGFIAITGEVGTGKTTLLRKLMHDFDKTVHFACIFNTLLTFDDLLWVALRDLGVPSERKDRLIMLDDLNTYLVEQFNAGHSVCLLIDEAQDLGDESLEGLRLLSNLETNKQKLLQIVLIGQPELNAKLDKPTLRQLKQRIAVQCKIVPLDEEEVGSYINFRLRVVNYHGKDLFEPEAIQKIALYSKGIPRLINILCDNALLTAFAASQKTVSANMVGEAASDLRLGSEAHGSQGDNTASATTAERKPSDHQATSRPLQPIVRRSAVIAFGAVVIIAFFFAGVLVSDRFFPRAVEVKHDSPLPKASPAPRPIIITQPPKQETEISEVRSTAAEIKWNDRLNIQYGSTVYEIAIEAYGANALLGLDLIKEYNPQIPNLNRVAAGEELTLPPLTPDTLVRPQPDGSYRLVVASFAGRAETEEFAVRLNRAGYRVAIRSRRVADDILLYRLEIDGLTNIEEATQILRNVLKNEWPTFPPPPASSAQETKGEIKY